MGPGAAGMMGLWTLKRLGWSRRKMADLLAYACLGCGRVTFYAADLAVLRSTAERNPQVFT